MRYFVKNVLLASMLALVSAAAVAAGPTIIPMLPGTAPTSYNSPTYDGLFIDLADGNLKYISPSGSVTVVGYSVLATANTWTALQSFTNGDLALLGSTSGSTLLEAAATAGTTTITFPAATDTVAVLGTAQTFTAAQTLGAGSSLKASNLLVSPTAPTIASACGGGSPSIVSNGTASMAVTIGTASGSTCVLTLPTAAHGWMCSAADVTTPATNLVQQTGSSTTGATFTNYVRTTGVAGTWTASDVIEISCLAN